MENIQNCFNVSCLFDLTSGTELKKEETDD